MKYTQKQKDVVLIGVCLIGAWIVAGIHLFGALAVVMACCISIGYMLGKVN